MFLYIVGNYFIRYLHFHIYLKKVATYLYLAKIK